MAELKTKKHAGSVRDFLDAVEDPRQRADAKKLTAMMRAATGERAALWGPSIVGFGSYHYVYESGREGFSPRKGNTVVYVMPGFERYDALMKKLGRFKTGKSCLYIRRLEDVDEAVLDELIRESVAYMRARYPAS